MNPPHPNPVTIDSLCEWIRKHFEKVDTKGGDALLIHGPVSRMWVNDVVHSTSLQQRRTLELLRWYQVNFNTCETCLGSGEVIDEKNWKPCPRCRK